MTAKPESTFPASIAKIVSESQLVINRGSSHGIKLDQRFLVYSVSDEDVTDPDTGKSLGQLEIPKGTGKVIHLQPSMAIIESDRRTQTLLSQSPLSLYSDESTYLVPFRKPKVGDKVKPV